MKPNMEETYINSNLKNIKFLLIMTIIVNIVMLVFDYFYSRELLLYFFIDRVLVNCSITILILVFLNHDFVKKNIIHMIAFLYLVTIIGMSILLHLNFTLYYITEIYLIIFCSMGFFYIRYKLVLWLNCVSFIAFTIVNYLNIFNDPLDFILLETYIITVIMVTFYFSSVLHFNFKKIYNNSERLMEDNIRVTKDLSVSKNIVQNMEKTSVYSIAVIAESHDDFTGDHLERVSKLSKRLTELIPEHIFQELSLEKTSFLQNIELASMLHDIGKVAVPIDILKKNGRLTKSERSIIETHAQKGYEILNNIFKLHQDFKVIEFAKNIALNHHENWDGSGYPIGLAGKDIPLSARIVSICDVFDALTQDRPYRKAYSYDKAKKTMLKEDHIKFDHYLLDLFFKMIDEDRA